MSSLPADLSQLRAVAAFVAIATTCLLVVVVPDRAVEAAYVAAGMALAWCVYLRLSWRSRGPLLATVSVLVGLGVFVICAENVIGFERITGIRVLAFLELSPRLTERINRDPRLRTRAWEQFGADLLFYRLEPHSEYRERADYRKSGPEYVTTADDRGFLNGDTSYYTRHASIDMFLAGDSVMQGVGMPGIVEQIRSAVPYPIYSVSTGGYGPREKVDALVQFAMSKRPRWLVLEFFAGNDATDGIEDEACQAAHMDYRCRFDTLATARALSRDRSYRGFGAYGEFGPTIDFLRGLRSNSFSLAIATRVARQIHLVVEGNRSVAPALHVNGELMTLPGFTHYPTPDARRVEWVRDGLGVARAAYDRLRAAITGSGARVVLVYNPTSYEIYRELIPAAGADRVADEIASFQSAALAKYARENDWAYCDLTGSFRAAVRSGSRGLFSPHDGTHWSKRGTAVAADALGACLASVTTHEDN